MSRTIITIILSIFTNSTVQGQEQPQVNNVIKYGIDFGDYLSTHNGSFPKEPEYTFGFLTGIKLYGKSNNALLLGIELDYTRSITYSLNVESQYSNAIGTYGDINDEKYIVSFLELGLSLEPCVSIDKDLTLGYYIGGLIGLGTQNVATNRLSHTLISSTTSDNYPEGPSGFTSPISIDTGLNCYYKRLMIDFRYRFFSIDIEQEVPTNVNNVYFQIGLVLL